MVQVIQRPRDPRDAALGQLSSALGQGLGQGLNTYFASRSLDSVLKDKSLANAPFSEKMGKLEEAMRGYGENGQNILKNRLMVEQQAETEKQQQQLEKQQRIDQKKGDILRRRLSGEEITEGESKIFTPQEELAIAKHEQALKIAEMKNNNKNPLGGISGQSVPGEVSKGIQEVLKNSQDLNSDELTQQFDSYGVPRAYSNAYIENRRRDDEMKAKQAQRAEELDYSSFKDNREYTEKILNGKEAYERDKSVLDQMEKISQKGDLPTPLATNLLQKLGLPLGILENPSAEQFEKLSQELMKNITGTYGSRILQTEVLSFMKSIPTLLNSPEGQKRLIKQWQILNEGKKVYYDSYKEIRKEYANRLPPDLHEKVLEKSEPKLQNLSDQFKSMNMFKTIIDPEGISRLIPEDQVEEALKFGGRLQ